MWILFCFLLILFDLIGFSLAIMARKMLIDGELDKSNQEEPHYDFDLFVIGAGSGGVRAARFSAQYGANKVLGHNSKSFVMEKFNFIYSVQVPYGV